MQPSVRQPSRLISAISGVRFRLRATRYGLAMQFAQTSPSGIFRTVMPVLTLALAATGFVIADTHLRPHPSPPVLGAIGLAGLTVLTAWLRSASSLSNIMRTAARSDAGAERIREDMARGMKNPHAYAQMIALYEPIVAAANEELPADRGFEIISSTPAGGVSRRFAAIAMPSVESETLESVLSGPLSPEPHERFSDYAESRQRLMLKWRRLDGSDKDRDDETGDNYRLVELRVGPRLVLTAGVASYGEIVRSCDALINEFALFAHLTGPRTARLRWRAAPLRMTAAATLRRLPWRRRAHRSARAPADLFLRPRDRAAGLGIAVVTLDREGGHDHVYLGWRSKLVGTYPLTNHVVPAGMCNVKGTQAHKENVPPPPSYLKRTMQAEFLEEWFKYEEFESDSLRRSWDERVLESWEARVLTPLDDGSPPLLKEDLALTGIAFDLLNLRPEICATAMVDTRAGELNWEFARIGFEGHLGEAGSLPPTEIVQSGAAALWLASRSRAAQAPALLRDGSHDG